MTNAMLEKRISTLEKEMRNLRTSLRPSVHQKKLPSGLEEALRDVREGRVYGPFRSIKDLRKSLEAPGL